MDTKTLVNNLHAFFCNMSKEGRKYTKVWLSREVALGMYIMRGYTLNLQSEHKIVNRYEEIREIISLLNDKAKPELDTIHKVSIHHVEDGYYCQIEDLLVFEEENNCM
jgi:hypothetical protein